MKCKKCEKDKALDEFYKAKNKLGYESTCKECRMLLKYEQRRNNRIRDGLSIRTSTLEARKLLKQNKKFCPKCEKIKGVDEFSTMKRGSGIASHCKECSREISKKYNETEKGKSKKKNDYQKNKIRQKNNKLIRDFGITYEDYKQILNEQKGRCAICGRTEEENGKMLAVDHDHETMKNRELLCASCNLVIGFIEKNNLDIDKIKNYINKHKII